MADFVQQGSKLTGSGEIGTPAQGGAVAVSSDGNTAVVGGPGDDGQKGAVWIFTRSGDTWTQQGPKLVGSGATGPQPARQGFSVAISTDGNTIVFGGVDDDYVATSCTTQSGRGAAWVFTRSGGVWTQQGAKLVGTGAVGSAGQGSSVALSGDGNTAIIGGRNDGTGTNGCGALTGAAWVFVRSGNAWNQQGAKLQGTTSGDVLQGGSVALSADGNTAALGGPGDGVGASTGAVWVFTRSAGVWSQQTKLVASDSSFNRQGASSALSADGNTLLSGAWSGNFSADPPTGATFVFTRSGSTWSQQTTLIGSGAVTAGGGSIQQGLSVGLSSDGNTAIVGGPRDNNSKGASWIFTRKGTAWTQLGAKLVGSGGSAFQGTAVAMSGDGGTAIVGGPNDDGIWVFVLQLPSTTVLSAVLPASRSVQIGTAATAFGTVINSGSNLGAGCGLSLGTSIPATFSYQTTDPATNAVTGTANTPAGIAAGGNQSYVFAITPSAAFAATDVAITAKCTNSVAAPSVVGLNTLLLSASATPVPDVVALAASSNPGYVDLPGNTGTGAFAVASVNVGSSAAITVTADTGGKSLPVSIALCQSNAQAACTNPATPGSSVSLTIAANATPTFSIFVTGSGNVANDPANNRVFVRFKDADGTTRGSTSVAVKTQ